MPKGKKTSTTGEEDTDRMATLADFRDAPPAVEVRAKASPQFGLGYRPDEPDPRDLRARVLFGARRTLPSEAFGLVDFIGTPTHQGVTNSCVGQAIGGAIDTRKRKTGKFVEPTSRLAIYTFARALDRAEPNAPLVDDGANPRRAFRALREHGVPPERIWPFDPAQVNEPLPWDVHQVASAALVASWWRVASSGREMVEDVCQAIAAGFPVVFGVDVDAAFPDHPKGRVATTQDPTRYIGGHMMYAVGYRTTKSGRREILNVNSWGTNWADRGLFWADEAFYAKTWDCYVMQLG